MSFDFGLQTMDLFVFDEHELIIDVIQGLSQLAASLAVNYLPKCFVLCCTKQGCPRLIFFGAITLPVFLNFNFGPSLRNVRGQRPEAGVTVIEP